MKAFLNKYLLLPLTLFAFSCEQNSSYQQQKEEYEATLESVKQRNKGYRTVIQNLHEALEGSTSCERLLDLGRYIESRNDSINVTEQPNFVYPDLEYGKNKATFVLEDMYHEEHSRSPKDSCAPAYSFKTAVNEHWRNLATSSGPYRADIKVDF